MTESDELLECYVKAINRLDDYFEYRCESGKDRQYVYHTLDLLNKELEKVAFKGGLTCKRYTQ